ncbi:hypothetical protein B7494_g8151 [Chlorociboria aeruginascens]|nr:hypothetical protein B7494_g8151 [Chlorociboria aeruginascens]
MAHDIHCMIYKLQDVLYNTNEAHLKEKLRLQKIAIANLQKLNGYMEDRLSTPWRLMDTKPKHRQWKRAFKVQGRNHARIVRWMMADREWMHSQYRSDFSEWQERGMVDEYCHIEHTDEKQAWLRIEGKGVEIAAEEDRDLLCKLKRNEATIFDLTKANRKLWVMEAEERAFLLRREDRGEYLTNRLWGSRNVMWYLARVPE